MTNDPKTLVVMAYQRLEVLVGRGPVTIMAHGGYLERGGVVVTVGALGIVKGEGEDLAAALKDVYGQVFPPESSNRE